MSHTSGEAHDPPLCSSPSGGLGTGTGGSELGTQTLWHFKEGYGSHCRCPGGTVVQSGGHLTGSTSPATPIRVWSTVQHRNCSPLDFILRTMEKGRLISLPPAGGHRALVWQLAGEEESSCSSQVPPLMPQQTRPSPTGHQSAECMVGFCQSSLCFYVFLPLPVPRPCGRIINSHGREGE